MTSKKRQAHSSNCTRDGAGLLLPSGPSARRVRLNALLMKSKALLTEYANQHDQQWATTVLSSGTVADRVAALTLLAENEPLVCLRPLDALLSMAQTDKRRESQMAIESLQHIFCRLLPRKRRLLRFGAQPGASRGDDASPRQLMCWAFEAGLKKRYKAFIGLLELGSSDRVFYFKRLCVRTSFELLCARPEQEQTLLAMAVNKLGDPEQRICSMVVHLLLQLVSKHPRMKDVVFVEVEKLLSRTNGSRTVTYNCVCFLNRIQLQRGRDDRFARGLIHTYFQLFPGSIGKAPSDRNVRAAGDAPRAGDVQCTHRSSRVLGMLLIGINRALPYAAYHQAGSSALSCKTDPLFRLVEGGELTTAVEALAVLVQIVRADNISPVLSGRKSVVARFYRDLDYKLGDPGIVHSSKRALFLNVLYRAMKCENAQCRSRLLGERLLHASAFADSAFAAGGLFLLSKVQAHARRALSSGAPVSTDAMDAPIFERRVQPFAWEIMLFVRHFHPSVEKLAQLLATDPNKVSYRGDPLRDLQPTSFLDRFTTQKPNRRQTPLPRMFFISDSD